MAIYSTLPDDLREVDVIVVGGGTSGCIVASNVASKDPGLKVLLIEYGANNQGNPVVANPLLWRAHLAPQTGTSIYYMGKTESQLGERAIPVATGGVLGGGSSINLAIYSRPSAADYDAWGARGWSADELRPFMNKVETYHGDNNEDGHGQNGPVHISGGPFQHEEAEESFTKAMNGLRYSKRDDLQRLDSQPGVARSLRYVSTDGVRQDVATTYLHPRLEDGGHPNLYVLLQSRVSKILFDDKRAVGVQYTSTSQSPETEAPSTREIKAKKLVILCAGTLGNPGILQRSGVGERSTLEAAGVPVVADVPGVGREYQDHPVVSYHYKCKVPVEETSNVASLDFPNNMRKLFATGSKLLGWNGFDATSKIRPTEGEAEALGSEFKRLWDRDHSNNSLATILLSVGLLGDPRTVPAGSYFSLGVFTLYPYSRGHVRITGPDAKDPLDFKTGLLSDKDDFDIKSHIWAYKKQREVARRMSIFDGEVEGYTPKYPEGSKAAVAKSVPIDDVENLIEYSADDDAAIEDWVRTNVTTCWHGLGTCKMGPREEFGVVDERLNVHCVKGLKIADLSIAPKNVSAHTNNTAMTIGEKAADIIIQELGL
ncbi:alcohol oxidase-like protein [Xylaria intraflava]|nr:alcohol oxidase-like protein [Xylaria intraflava]